MWSKLKKTLSFKSSTAIESSNIPTNLSDSQSSSANNSSSSSSSFSAKFSRSFSSNVQSSKKTCAICLGNVRSGQGQAIFTAECSHIFHFSCIANSVKHGNYLCPICRFKWKEIPFQLPNSNADANSNNVGRARVSPYQTPAEDYNFTRALHREPIRYSDDEPLLVVSSGITPPVPLSNVSLKTFTEFHAVAATQSVSDFAVLVGVRAPSLVDDARRSERAPIDLVAVLDVSGSMGGSKLDLLKRAVCFVIDNLGSDDRLSVVAFSASARRVFALRRMTSRGREDARIAVNSLSADGGTNILLGLEKGARVLEERHERNPVASIILLSDGKDTYNGGYMSIQRGRLSQNSRNSAQFVELLNLLPASIRSHNSEPLNENRSHSFAVHAFGFGSDHDSSAMNAISDASGGTFSFIESVDMVQDAFARCIGGLLSVVAQELRLTITSASPGVQIGLIPSGRYANDIYDQGLRGVVSVGDMYADEEKEFLIYLSVPACHEITEDEEVVKTTSLLKIQCSYMDTTNTAVNLEGKMVEIRRPMILSSTDRAVSLEVDRQRHRLSVAESIAEAQAMAEVGNLEGAQAVLTNRRSLLLSSASAQAGDSLCSWLEAELTDLRERMANMEMYEQTGRAYMLSGLSSHSWQRATTRGDSTSQTIVMREGGSSSHSGSMGYNTPAMVTMVSKSQNLSNLNSTEQVQRQNKSTSLTRM